MWCGIEHEDIDPNVVASALFDFLQSERHRLGRRRVVELGFAKGIDMGCRFPIGDHEDLLRAGLSRQHLPGELEAMLHIGSVDVIPRKFREFIRWDFTGDLAKGDHAQVVLWVLPGDQRLERQRNLFGWDEVVLHGHRQAQVEHENGGGAGRPFGSFDLEVVRCELDGRAPSSASDSVANRSFDVECERVAEFILFGLEISFVPDARNRHVVAPNSIRAQLAVEIRKNVLTDLSQPPRRELHCPFFGVDQASFFEHLRELSELLHRVRGVFPEELCSSIEIQLS